MTVEIKNRRTVPDKEGYVAWGFGDTSYVADKNAIERVFEVRKYVHEL